MLKKLISTVLCMFALTAVCANAQTTLNGNAVSFDEAAEYRIVAAYSADGRMTGVQMFSEETAELDYAKLAANAGGECSIKVFSWGESFAPVADVVEKKVTSLDVGAFDYESESYDGWDREVIAEAIANDNAPLCYYPSSGEADESEKYVVETDTKLFVNNVELDWDYDNIYNYIVNNTTGNVVMNDADNNGEYDAVYVSHYKSALISDVMDTGKVYFEVAELADGMPFTTYVEFDEDMVAEGALTYSITLDGKQIEYSDLQSGDVVSIAYDVSDDFEYSSFYDVIVNRQMPQGLITAEDEDSCTFTVNDTEYKYDIENLVDGYTSDAVGTEAILYIDVFGRIVYIKEAPQPLNLAILENVWLNTAEDIYFVKLILPDGEVVNYEVKEEDDVWDLMNIVFVDAESGEKNPLYDRVITYKLNSSNLIYNVDYADYKEAEAGYAADMNKIGSVKLGSGTKLLDASEYDGKTSDIVAIPVDMLSDGAEYWIYAYDKLEDGTYSFVLVMSGIGDYTDNTQPAVFIKAYTGVDSDGEAADAVTLLCGGEEKDFIVSELDGTVSDLDYLNKGDVVIYKTNYDNEITCMDIIAEMYLCDGSTRIDYEERWIADFYYPDEWDPDYSIDTEVELYYGVIETLGDDYIYMTECDNFEYNATRYNIDSTAKVYVYDYTKSANSALYAGTLSDIEATVIPYSARYRDYSIEWDEMDYNTINYAFIKAVAGKVTDIFVINAPENGVMDSVDTTSDAYTANYGIIDSVDTESNTVRIISSQGETKEFSAGESLTAGIIADMIYDKETGEKSDIENRLCIYEYSGSTITKFELSPIDYIFEEKYNAEIGMFGYTKLSSSVVMLDATEIDEGTVSVVKPENLKEDVSYDAVACGWVEDGYKFVVLVGGLWDGYNEDTRTAIFVKSFEDTNDDGDAINCITVLYDGEEKNFELDASIDVEGINKGDVIVFKSDNDVIFVMDIIMDTGVCNGTIRVDYDTTGYWFDLYNPDSWYDAELDFGVIVDKTSTDFVITDYGSDESTSDERYYDLTDETIVYVYSYKEAPENALFTGAKSNILKTSVHSAAKDDDDNILWEEINEYGVNYAFVHAEDNEAKEVFVIIGPGKADY